MSGAIHCAVEARRLAGLFVLALALLLIGRAARAQGAAYCNITRISTVRLANAVQITVRADGVMRVDWNPADFFNLEAISRGNFEQAAKPISVLPLHITNARSKVMPLTDVDQYPVSHLELSLPPNAPEGIGVDMRLVLFAPATTLSVQTPEGFELPLGEVAAPTVTVTMTPDQMSLIILVVSDRQTLPPFSRYRPAVGAPVELTVTGEGDRVSVEALNADLRDVVRRIADRTGRPILVDGVGDHAVSVSLPDTPVDAALDALSMAYGLSVDRTGGVVRLAEALAGSIPSYGQSAMATIRLKHASAVSVRNALPEFLLRYLRVSVEENALTVFGPPELVEKVRRDAEAIDLPVPQVAIQALAVELTSSTDLGALLNASEAWRDNQVTLDTGGGDISFQSAGPLPAGFQARLNALSSEGRARTVARPSAVVLNGRTAQLFVGQQRYVKVLYYDMFAGQYLGDILPVDVGVKLKVTPWTGGRGEIMVDVAPEITSVAEREPVTGLPTVYTRNASATLRVRDGETLVIGGLTMAQEDRGRRKIPILGDLPLIGNLFRAPKRARSRNELVLFVTARLVNGDAAVLPEEAKK